MVIRYSVLRRRAGFATIESVIQFRRLASVLLGLWLGAGIVTDVTVTTNFSTVDRFLQSPGSVATSIELNQIGRAKIREILRRNAGEENNFIFENWELAELGLGSILFFVLLFGDRPQISMIALTALMLAIVLAQHLFLSPQITSMGRAIVGLPNTSAEYKRFWMFHGIYSGSEILKLVIGFAFMLRLVIRQKADPNQFAKEYAATQPTAAGKAV